MRLVEIVEYPSPIPTVHPPRHLLRRRQQKAAEKISDAERGHRIRSPQTLHPFRRLIVEKLDLGHLEESVGDSHEQELWEEDEDGERDSGAGGGDAVGTGGGEAVALGEAGDEHDDDVDDEAGAHAAEERDAAGVAGEAAGEGDEGAVVDDDGGEHADGDEGGEAGGGNAEMGPDAAVEGGALFDEKSVDLGYHRAGDEGGHENGDHPKHLLGFFYLGDGAEGPWAARRSCFDRCFAEKSTFID